MLIEQLKHLYFQILEHIQLLYKFRKINIQMNLKQYLAKFSSSTRIWSALRRSSKKAAIQPNEN
jgi:hypothetical protein